MTSTMLQPSPQQEHLAVCRRAWRGGSAMSGEITSLVRLPRPEQLRDRTGMLMISIKNQLFRRSLIDAFCRFASEGLETAYLTVVDRPYLHNAAAMSNGRIHSRQIDGIRRLSECRVQMVQRILRRYDQQRIRFVSWDDLSAQVPQWLTEEVEAAWQCRGRLYADLLDHARERVGEMTDRAALERWALFLVEETPVLLYAYYLFRGGAIDFYPAAQARYMWRIERGDYAVELPRTTALAQSHPGLIYVHLYPPADPARPAAGDSGVP